MYIICCLFEVILC